MTTTPDHDPSPHRSALRARCGVAAVLLLIALVPLIPTFLSRQYPGTHESFRYEELTMLFADAIRHGFLYPRWLPDLVGGHGYPTFVFYQPLVFWVSSAVSLLPIGPSRWMYITDAVFFLIGAAGAYRLARVSLGRTASLSTAALFILSPYAFVNLHIRGDHSELASMMLLPWPLWSLVELRRRFPDRRAVIADGASTFGVALVGAVALAAVICAHPATALIGVPLLALMALAQCFTLRGSERKSWLLLMACVCALALAVASPYWFCVWQCAPFVHLDRVVGDYYQPQFHTLELSRLLSNEWSYGGSAEHKVGKAAMSLPIGLVHFGVAIAGMIAGWRSAWVRLAGAAYLLLLLAILPISNAFWEWEGNPLRILQFPWRLLTILAPLQVMLLIPLLSRWKATWIGPALALVAAAWGWRMFAVLPVPHRLTDGETATLAWAEADEHMRANVAALSGTATTYSGVNEFVPIWVRAELAMRGDGPLVVSRDSVRFLPGHTKYTTAAEVTASTDDAVIIEQLYFPGWRVEVNGDVVPDEALRDAVTDDGRMLVAIRAGTSTVRAWYAGPPLGGVRWTGGAIVALFAIGLLWKLDRPTKAVERAAR